MKSIGVTLSIFLLTVATLPTGVLHRHHGSGDLCAYLTDLVASVSHSHTDHDHHCDGHHHDHAHPSADAATAAEAGPRSCCDDHDHDADPVEREWIARQRGGNDNLDDVPGDLAPTPAIPTFDVTVQLTGTWPPVASDPPPLPPGTTGILQRNHALLL